MTTDIESFLHNMAAEVDPRPMPSETIKRTHVRRVATMVSLFLALGVAIAGASLGIKAIVGDAGGPVSHPIGGPYSSPSAAPSCESWMDCPVPPPTWIVHADTRDGLAIVAPRSWTYRDTGISGPIDPAPEIAIGTWDFPTGGRCAPTKALTSVPLGGAFFYLFEQEAGSPRDFPRRPAHFHLGLEKGPFECLGVRTYLIQFRERSRYFTVHIVVGRIADTDIELKRNVLRSLDSLTVGPRTATPVSSSG
ncbi:MAG: hypothetical protein ABR579_01990 [Actinomycetota bacterium]